MSINSSRAIIAIALSATSAFACSGEHDVWTPEELDEAAEIGTLSEALSGPTDFFDSYTYHTTGPGQTERYLDCQADQILTGLGARVDGSSNFTDLTIYCRNILPDGTLEPAESSFTVGGPGEEISLHASDESAIIAVGAIVSVPGNLARLVFRQCPWIAATRRINDGNCNFLSTNPGSNSTELMLNVHNGLSASARPRTVATGVGLSASNNNTSAIRMSSGRLR